MNIIWSLEYPKQQTNILVVFVRFSQVEYPLRTASKTKCSWSGQSLHIEPTWLTQFLPVEASARKQLKSRAARAHNNFIAGGY